jgi:hypothetical protein
VSNAHEATSPTLVSSPSRGFKVLLPIGFFLVAVGILVAAFYYIGGADYVSPLLGSLNGSGGGNGAAPAGITTAAPDPIGDAFVLPPGVSQELAQRMYVEQLQSQANLKELATGGITSLRVTSVRASGPGSAAAFVTARFADGSSAPGVIQLVRAGDAWYFMSFTGLGTSKISGSADTVGDGTVKASEQSNAQVIAESGVTTFDYAVTNAFLGFQTANQSIAVSVVGGEITEIAFGQPKEGVGTTVVPVTMGGAGVPETRGEAVLIKKRVAGRDHLFLTGFRVN